MTSIPSLCPPADTQATKPPKRAYHNPKGDPCTTCGAPARVHRIEHNPSGDPCTICGLPLENHYKKRHRLDSERRYYVGIDGEGQGRADHRYVMLAWSNEKGNRRAHIEAPEGKALSTIQCLEFILDLPKWARAFAFAFNYDLTKILQDCDDETLYKLFRPELRQRPPGKEKLGPYPVLWNGYRLNLLGSKFSVEKTDGKHKRRAFIWDVFKFFQCKFTQALEDWKVEDPAKLEAMRNMKDQRANFDTLTRKQILDYCFDECAYMATLARKLTEAHEAAGLKLTGYHGAGSTASAVLKRMGIHNEERFGPDEMKEAVASAFFGGRFENRVVGVIKGPLYSRDISSAYPYQITFLPCLGCGKWEKVKKRSQLKGATTACVRYKLGTPPVGIEWAPFPFRTKDGSICFPASSGGGWVWLDEFLAGERLFPHVRFVEAWVYKTDCGHRPFADIPPLYTERLRIGKEGPGIVIKLGCNACYGKLAQSLGVNPPFQSWIWAGMVTSGTRAQILELLAMHKDPRNLYMIATDGIYTTENFPAPQPRDTGTGDAVDDKGKPANKPLGGWETKEVKGDMFAARPGIYFPVAATKEDIKQIRARGVGRAAMVENAQAVMCAWAEGKEGVRLPGVSRFWGAKSSIGRVPDPENPKRFVYTRHIDPLTRKPRYGQWASRPVDMSFNPLPKRDQINPDGTLSIRYFPANLESAPYDNSIKSMDARALRMALEEILEQPDGGDFTDYEDGAAS